MKYSEYLESAEWKIRRNKMLSHFQECQRCGYDEELRIHHKHYESVGNEKFSDLVVLCDECHEAYHEQFGKIPSPSTTDLFILQINHGYRPVVSNEKILGKSDKRVCKKPNVRRFKGKGKFEKLKESKMHRRDSEVTVRNVTKEDLARFGYQTR